MKKQITVEEQANTISELIEYYEICNRAEGKSPKTISWYTANLKCFRQYLSNRHLPDSIDKVDIKLLRQYILCLMKRSRYDEHPHAPAKKEPLSAATVQTRNWHGERGIHLYAVSSSATVCLPLRTAMCY